jgi:hypothetical protein
VTVPPNAPVTVKVIFMTKGDSLPSSVLGACRLLERKLNAAIATSAVLADITATCAPSSDDKGIRVRLSNPHEYDSSVTFAKLGRSLGSSEEEPMMR